MVIEHERAVGHLRLVGHEQVVDHLLHHDLTRVGEVRHLVEIDTVQQQSGREGHLTLTADDEVAVVVRITNCSQEHKVRCLVDHESLQTLCFLRAAQAAQHMDGCIGRIHYDRLARIARVVLGILEDGMAGAEHFHVLYFRFRVLRVRTDVPVRQTGYVGLETEDRFLVDHRAQRIGIAFAGVQEVRHDHQVVLVVIGLDRGYIFRLIAVHKRDIVIVVQIVDQTATRRCIASSVFRPSTTFLTRDDERNLRFLALRIDTNRCGDFVCTGGVATVLHDEFHRHVLYSPVAHIRRTAQVDIFVEVLECTAVDRVGRFYMVQLVGDTFYLIFAGQFNYTDIHFLLIPNRHAR